jgi:hypothetical protein
MYDTLLYSSNIILVVRNKSMIPVKILKLKKQIAKAGLLRVEPACYHYGVYNIDHQAI